MSLNSIFLIFGKFSGKIVLLFLMLLRASAILTTSENSFCSCYFEITCGWLLRKYFGKHENLSKYLWKFWQKYVAALTVKKQITNWVFANQIFKKFFFPRKVWALFKFVICHLKLKTGKPPGRISQGHLDSLDNRYGLACKYKIIS